MQAKHPRSIRCPSTGKNLELFVRVINQDCNDCASRRERNTRSMSVGNKSAIAKTRYGLIVSALSFMENPCDGHMVTAHLEQTKRLPGAIPEDAELHKRYSGRCHQYAYGCAAFNMRHWKNKISFSSYIFWLRTLVGRLEIVIFGNQNQYACQNSYLAFVAK